MQLFFSLFCAVPQLGCKSKLLLDTKNYIVFHTIVSWNIECLLITKLLLVIPEIWPTWSFIFCDVRNQPHWKIFLFFSRYAFILNKYWLLMGKIAFCPRAFSVLLPPKPLGALEIVKSRTVKTWKGSHFYKYMWPPKHIKQLYEESGEHRWGGEGFLLFILGRFSISTLR